MANVDRPNGFRFAKSLSGHAPNAMLRKYTSSDRSADTTGNHGDIYRGDPLKFASGLVLPANSGDQVVGVCIGFGKDAIEHGETIMVNADDLGQRFSNLADTTDVIWAMPVEGNVFEVQTASDLDLLQGSLADHNLTAATAHGSRTTGVSNVELVAASNNDVKVVENNLAPDNDITLANAMHLVMFVNIENAQP